MRKIILLAFAMLIIAGCSKVKKYHMGSGVFDHVEYVSTNRTHVFLKNSSGRYILKGHHSVLLLPGDRFDLFENIHYQWFGLEDHRDYNFIIKEAP